MQTKRNAARLLWPDDAIDIDKKLKKERTEQLGKPCHNCGIPMITPQFDHNHGISKFRGWLCAPCNSGLGKLGDNIAGLEQAIRYLKRTDETTD